MAETALDVKPLAQQMTLCVRSKRLRQWQWRITLGTWLICLAAQIMWMNVEVQVEDGP